VNLGDRCPKCRRVMTGKTSRVVKRKGRRDELRCLPCNAQRQRKYDARRRIHKKVKQAS
jgi:hypothetical protein